MKKVNVIGSGFAGLSAAAYLAKAGHQVDLFEKNEMLGGRARKFSAEGFTFDMGPSWYWMPDVFEDFFANFNHSVSDFYHLLRLDPSYRVYFGEDDHVDLPASLEGLCDLFESLEKGAGKKLRKFLAEAEYKYKVGIQKLVHKPSKSLLEFADPKLLYGLIKMDVFNSLSSQVRRLFKHPKLIEILEFPVLFLGATPQKIPALYSLMNYADMVGGTWYPQGGMHRIVEAMVNVAKEQGVNFHTDSFVDEIVVKNGLAQHMMVNGQSKKADYFVAGADYHHVDQFLLQPEHRNYSADYWDKRVLAPSSLIFYLGVDKRLQNLLHHNLFFDEDFGLHAKEIYEDPQWPEKPLFYVCAPSVTDPSVAPEGKENIFILIPVAPNLDDPQETKDFYYNLVMDRLEKLTKQKIREHVTYRRDYSHTNFKEDYHAFKGNAYGLANTLKQTAILKPQLANKKVKNLFYTGQLTVPGPGVPPSIISGEVVSKEIHNITKVKPNNSPTETINVQTS